MITTTHNGPAILVVDDDYDQRGGMADVLALEGYSVDTASDAYRAAELLDHRRYDLVISDIELPGHGLSTLGHVRRNQPETPVILVSGLTDETLRRRARESGAFAVLEKPLTGPVLRAVIGRALEAGLDSDGELRAAAAAASSDGVL
jgi:two-component system C4-dicarboxylate transport response regulator DctD